MTEYVLVKNQIDRDLIIPDEFKLVSSTQRQRNREKVRVERYQQEKEVVSNNTHLTLVYGEDGRLISYNNFFENPSLPLPSENNLVQLATDVWENLDADYARGLQFMRIDRLKRFYKTSKGKRIDFDVLWIKFAHNNGSYNWVTIGPGGQIMEVERGLYAFETGN